MDTKKECMIPKCGHLADLAGKKVVVGAKQLRKAILNRRAECVFLAKNADPAVTDPLLELCVENHIAYVWVDSKFGLGSACGIEVGAAAAATVH